MKALGRSLLLAGVSLALFLGAAELVARLRYDPGARAPDGIFEYDPDKVFTLRKSVEGRFIGRRVVTNSHGHRDDEIPTAKPPGTRRVVVLGDSVSFGHGVDGDETWPQQLEARLRSAQGGDGFDVINAAVPGNGPFQEYHDARRLLALEPDLFVLQFTPNDVTEPYQFLRRLGGSGWDYHRVADVPYLHWLLSRHSALYLFLRDAFARLRFLDPGGERIAERAAERESYAVGNLVLHPERPELEEAWEECLRWLQRIADLAAEAGVPLVLVASPFHTQLGLAHAEAHPQQQLRRFAEANRIVYLDLLADLQRRLLRSPAGDDAARDPATRADLLRSLGEEHPERLAAFWRRFYLDGGHLSPRGHRWVAALLVPVVTEVLELSPEQPPGVAPDQLQAR